MRKIIIIILIGSLFAKDGNTKKTIDKLLK